MRIRTIQENINIIETFHAKDLSSKALIRQLAMQMQTIQLLERRLEAANVS